MVAQQNQIDIETYRQTMSNKELKRLVGDLKILNKATTTHQQNTPFSKDQKTQERHKQVALELQAKQLFLKRLIVERSKST